MTSYGPSRCLIYAAVIGYWPSTITIRPTKRVTIGSEQVFRSPCNHPACKCPELQPVRQVRSSQAPRIRPMRLRVTKPFNDPDYIFELKHDGFRAIA